MTRRMSDLGVLIVDDSDNARKLMTTVLKEIGVRKIHAVVDGAAALKFLERGGDLIELIICDWQMPGMTGLELLTRIHAAYPTVPFVMVTGKRDLDSVVAAKERGVSGYIVKPYSPKQVKDKIEAIFSMASAT